MLLAAENKTMSKKMLIDAAQSEEIRVAVTDGKKVEDFDFESSSRKPLRGNIYLARVTRVEPSLQAAFVEYGGNRHGFLAFSEIHPDYYQIPVSDREILQAAEKEVAELADELEIFQRGDDDGEELDGDVAPKDDDGDGDDHEPEEVTEAGAGARDDDHSEDDHNEDADDASDNDGAQDDDQDDDQDGDQSVVAMATPDNDEVSTPADPEFVDETAEAPAHDDESDSSDDNESDVEDTLDHEASSNETEDDDDGATDGNEGARSRRSQHAALLEKYREARRNHGRIIRSYKIQEVIKPRQILLIQVVKEERGNKGAALTSYMSLAGRYCVLMPNTARGGGISRKIPSASDRKRLRRIVNDFDVKQGMGLIIRTAGAKRTKSEIKRDFDYLIRLWDSIRELTMKSVAPCLIYEEASLIKRAIRDLYDKDISKVLVEGEEGYKEAKSFMKMLMPSHAKNVQPYKEERPLFMRYDVEQQLDMMYQPTVQLKSGGYLVIHQTEALIAVDVNSGKSTRERNIETTALKTNIEAAQEVARQCKLRDLAGLIVIDFIDMEENKNNRSVERKLKDAMKTDRARIQIGRISSFGLMEMSRQRRRSGIIDGTTNSCPTCAGSGVVRSHEMAALRILRSIEAESVSGRAGIMTARTSQEVALYILNHKREWLNRIEEQYAITIEILADPAKAGDHYDIEKRGAPRDLPVRTKAVQPDLVVDDEDGDEDQSEVEARSDDDHGSDDKPKRKRRRRRRRRPDGERPDGERPEGERGDGEGSDNEDGASEASADGEASSSDREIGEDGEEKPKKRRRRGRRGGRRRREAEEAAQSGEEGQSASNDDGVTQPSESGDESAQPDMGEPNLVAEESPVAEASSATETSGNEPSSVEPSSDEANNDEPEKPKRRRKKATKTTTRKRTKKATSDEDSASAGDAEKPEAVKKPRSRKSTANGTAPEANGVDQEASASSSSPSESPTSSSEPVKTKKKATKKKSKKGWWQRAIGG